VNGAKLRSVWDGFAGRLTFFLDESALGAEQVLERVSQHFQCDLERRGIRNGLLRRRAVTLCWYHEKRALKKDFSCALVTFKEMRGSQ
jgi:hypothetical protein